MTKQELIELGFNPFVAEPLADFGFSKIDVVAMTSKEMLDHVFDWHGIRGQALHQQIIDAVDNCRNMEALLENSP